uniref:Phospholipase A2 n=1 Tax=Haemonchus contortus TaxID=6289 RepID=A0A7I5E6X7_HAECO|nr:Phospholipase A2 domain containing protein [Haemonchus contortus]
MYRLFACLASIPLLYSAPSVPSEPVVGAASVHPPQPLVGSLWNLRQVGECTLHYSPICYNNYGCWCGIGGSHEPIDEIDKCCMLHDKCYDAAVDNKICLDVAWEYIDIYNWQCTNNTATCLDAEGTCKRALCDCDTAVVNCWAQHPKPNRKLKCNRSRLAPKSIYFQH